MKITKRQLRRIIRESLSSVRVEGWEVSVGDSIGFKEDIEQEAEIIKIEPGGWITVKAPPEGFEGGYIRRQQTHRLNAVDAWLVNEPERKAEESFRDSGWGGELSPSSHEEAREEIMAMIMTDARNAKMDDPSLSAKDITGWLLDTEPWISNWGLENWTLAAVKANVKGI